MTAVEWFSERIQSNIIFNFENVLKKALEMEKQQIIDAWEDGFERGYGYRDAKFDSSEQYYNEKYGGDK